VEPSSAQIPGSSDFRLAPETPAGWRGDGSGRFPAATPATEWSAKKNVRWSTPVGKSYSSPIVTDKLAIVTSEPNLIVCLNRADGKIVWKVEVKPADLSDEKSRKAAAEYHAPEAGSGMAAATPLTDGGSVYAVFASGIVRAVGLDGKPKWAAFIDAEQNTGYGRSSSPIMAGGKLIVHMTHLYAFDPVTGDKLWVNTSAESTYGTPASLKVGDTGVILTPAGDVVRTSDGKGLNSDVGRCVHASPIAHDGVIYYADVTVKALRLNAAFKDEELWTGDVTGDVFGSPVLHNGILFVVSGKGELYAFDAKEKGAPKPIIDGRILFGEGEGSRLPATYSSLTLAGKHLFLSSNQGETVVLEATREARQIARNRLPFGSGATPVFSGKDMFLRDGDKLYCIGE
jgi:hypothetical protein